MTCLFENVLLSKYDTSREDVPLLRTEFQKSAVQFENEMIFSFYVNFHQHHADRFR